MKIALRVLVVVMLVISFINVGHSDLSFVDSVMSLIGATVVTTLTLIGLGA